MNCLLKQRKRHMGAETSELDQLSIPDPQAWRDGAELGMTLPGLIGPGISRFPGT